MLEYLDYTSPDVHGFVADASLIGQVLSHTGNDKQYTVTGFAWLGASDEWGFVARAMYEHGVDIVRPLSHLCSKRSNGEDRYQEADYYMQYAV